MTRTAIIESDSYREGVLRSFTLSGGFFGPNILFLDLTRNKASDETLRTIVRRARHFSLGLYLFVSPPNWEQQRDRINIWVSDLSPDWDPSALPLSLDLFLLTGYILGRNWNANLRVVCGIQDEPNLERAELFFKNYLKQARFTDAELMLIEGDLDRVIEEAPDADLEILGVPR